MSVMVVGAYEVRTGPLLFRGFTTSSAIALPAILQPLPWVSVDRSRTAVEAIRCRGRTRSRRACCRIPYVLQPVENLGDPLAAHRACSLYAARVARTTPMNSQLPFTTTGRCGIPTWRYLETGSSVAGLRRFAN